MRLILLQCLQTNRAVIVKTMRDLEVISINTTMTLAINEAGNFKMEIENTD
jgi:hypothetical protein